MRFNNNRDLQKHIDVCTVKQKDIFNEHPKLWEKKSNCRVI